MNQKELDGDTWTFCECEHQCTYDCGCGKHKIDCHEGFVLHWKGLHWNGICVIETNQKEITRLRAGLAVMVDKTNIPENNKYLYIHDIARDLLEGK